MVNLKGTLSPISFQKYEENGAPTVLIYDAVNDETKVIDQLSPYYLHAVTALIVLEKCADGNFPVENKKENVIQIKKPKLVVDNGIA